MVDSVSPGSGPFGKHLLPFRLICSGLRDQPPWLLRSVFDLAGSNRGRLHHYSLRLHSTVMIRCASDDQGWPICSPKLNFEELTNKLTKNSDAKINSSKGGWYVCIHVDRYLYVCFFLLYKLECIVDCSNVSTWPIHLSRIYSSLKIVRRIFNKNMTNWLSFHINYQSTCYKSIPDVINYNKKKNQ